MIQVPKPATLKKYGLTEKFWRAIIKRQGPHCAVCGKVPSTNRLVIDHEHVKGWKKLPPEQRRRYIRGLCCWVCNHYVLCRGISIAKLKGAVKYLKRYEERKANYD